MSRGGKAISGLLYGSLGITVLNLLDTLRDLHKGEDQAIAVASMQATLALPFGVTLVVLGGVLLFLTGVGNIVRAFVDDFTSSLACDPRWTGLINCLARTGYVARGVAFLPAGLLTALAGWHARADEAVSLGKSLDLFQTIPFGRTLLILQALGLASFGIFGLVKAVFRRVASS